MNDVPTKRNLSGEFLIFRLFASVPLPSDEQGTFVTSISESPTICEGMISPTIFTGIERSFHSDLDTSFLFDQWTFISLVPRNWTADDFVTSSHINMVRKLRFIFFFFLLLTFFFYRSWLLEDSLQPTTTPSWLPSIVSLKIDSIWCPSLERRSCSRFVNANRCQVLFWWGQEEELIRIVSLIWVGTKS
jgi:hypothetical protein